MKIMSNRSIIFVSRLLLSKVISFLVLILVLNTVFTTNVIATTYMAGGDPNKSLNNPPPHLLSGFDWSLPEKTTIKASSGFVGENNHDIDVVNNTFIIVLWDKTNPKQGVYDFSELDRQINSLGHRKSLIRLEVNSSCEAPAWVLEKTRESKDKSLIFWDQSYIDALKPYLNEFARRYADSPKIAGVQLGIGDGEFKGPCDNYNNKDGWGEFWMSPEVVTEAEQKFGFTPEIFERRSKEIVKIYADAFGQYGYKLAFTNQGPLYTWGDRSEPYNQALARIADYAFSLGLGTRDGEVEVWLRYIDKNYGSYLKSHPDNTCSLEFDENYADKIRGRYWGTENEFYGNKGYILDRHGPYENQPYRFLISSLRALQMRRNFVTVSDDSMMDLKHPIYKTQDFMHYLNHVTGKQMEDTPDVFVLLGERYVNAYRAKNYSDEACVKNNGNKIPVRSFGRWLTESSDSQAALKIDMPVSEKRWGQEYYLPSDVDYEYAAREAKRFHFDLNDELSSLRCNTACNVEVKATFKDTAKTNLAIQVAEGISSVIQTRGDGKIKTVSFKIRSSFKNKLDGKDLKLLSKEHAIPLILMRINFL